MKLTDLHLTPSTLRHFIAKETAIGAGPISRQSASWILKNPEVGNNKRRIEAGLRDLKDAIEEYLESQLSHNQKLTNMGDELLIEVREGGISIQSEGIGNDQTSAREILQSALDALDSDREKEVFGSEIVVKN